MSTTSSTSTSTAETVIDASTNQERTETTVSVNDTHDAPHSKCTRGCTVLCISNCTQVCADYCAKYHTAVVPTQVCPGCASVKKEGWDKDKTKNDYMFCYFCDTPFCFGCGVELEYSHGCWWQCKGSQAACAEADEALGKTYKFTYPSDLHYEC